MDTSRDSKAAAPVCRPDPLSGRGLAAFVAALESGSVQSGADRLNLTQSAMTKRIQALERRLGLKLLVRGRFGVRPTEAGLALLPEARQALTALGRAEASAEFLRSGTEQLRLAASHTIGGYLLMHWLATSRFMQRGRPRLELMNSPLVLSTVSSGHADIGFIEGPEEVRGLDTLTMRRDEIGVIVAAGHPWVERGAPVTTSELQSEPYIAREKGSGTRAFTDHALEERGVSLTPALEVASVEVIKQAVASGSGFALMSKITVEEEAEAGKLASLSIGGIRIQRHLRAVRQHGTNGHGVAHSFWCWLERNASEGFG